MWIYLSIALADFIVRAMMPLFYKEKLYFSVMFLWFSLCKALIWPVVYLHKFFKLVSHVYNR